MVKINKIYTKSGDDGTTGLIGGSRVSKDHPQIQISGEIDELNSWVGVLRSLKPAQDLDQVLARVQNDLFDIGAEIATPVGCEWPNMCVINQQHVSALEQLIDKVTDGLPELRSFVLPGGSMLNAYFHITRSVCRRAERSLVSFAQSTPVRPEVLHYLNRLSDTMFALARAESKNSNLAEFLWVPGGGQVK